jgi:hypothetical protein
VKEFIREMIELSAKKRWLKEIDRQLETVNRSIRKVRRAQQAVDRQKLILQGLIDEYNKRYHDGLGVKEEKPNGSIL